MSTLVHPFVPYLTWHLIEPRDRTQTPRRTTSSGLCSPPRSP